MHTRPLTTRRFGESGQVAAWFVALFGLLLGMMTLTIDIGFWLLDRGHGQNQVDAAVLAAVQDLPAMTPSAAAIAAQQYLNRNNRINQGTVNSECAARPSATQAMDYDLVLNGSGSPAASGYAFADIDGDGDYDKIRACVRRSGLIIFGSLFKLAGVTVPAVAAATVQELTSPQPYAIFANDDHPDTPRCTSPQDDLQISSSDASVQGRVHTNCVFKVSGTDVYFNGDVTYTEAAPPTQCGSSGVYSGPPGSTDPLCDDDIDYDADGEWMPIPDPQTWNQVWNSSTSTFTDVCDTKSTSKLTFDAPGDIVNDPVNGWVYCTTDEIDITSGIDNITRKVTFITKDKVLKISANGVTFTPAWRTAQGYDLLLFSYSSNDPAIDISGQRNNWTGSIYAPRGRVTYAGSDGAGTQSTFNSSIVADRVHMSGQNWFLNGIASGPSTSEKDFFLVE